MPDALELLTTRRSFKAVELVGPAPSEAEIDTLLTVASRLPDHGKLAPWRFIVFEGESRRSAGEAIAAAFRVKYPDARPEHIAAERASGAGATRDRRGEPRQPACENPGMGAGALRRCRTP
jgi:nitroreductase